MLPSKCFFTEIVILPIYSFSLAYQIWNISNQ